MKIYLDLMDVGLGLYKRFDLGQSLDVYFADSLDKMQRASRQSSCCFYNRRGGRDIFSFKTVFVRRPSSVY